MEKFKKLRNSTIKILNEKEEEIEKEVEELQETSHQVLVLVLVPLVVTFLLPLL